VFVETCGRNVVSQNIQTIPLPGLPLGSAVDPTEAAGAKPALPGFVVGPENGLVEVAVRAILDPGANGASPLVLYGPTGTGKSPLARGLAGAFRAQFQRPVVYATAGDFARQVVEAFETQSIEEFRIRHRSAGLVVIEDLQEVSGKEVAQEELIGTIDARQAAGCRSVFTCRVAPGLLSGFRDRLLSRLVGGLVVPLVPPGPDVRRAILQQLADARGIDLPGAVMDLLAERLRTTVRGLSRALFHMEMTSRVEGRPITPERTSRFIEEESAGRDPDLGRIAALPARYFSLRLAALRSTSRRQSVVQARGVAMYLARQLTHASLEQIGRYFGGRDHTTVMHGCRKTQESLRPEPQIHKAILDLQEQLQPGVWKRC